jgi:hypothetical protein
MATATPLTLTLNDGTNTVTVVDGGAGDFNPTNGVVTWFGSLGSWSVNVSTGLGFPVLGSLAWPKIDLNSVNVSNDPGGTLELMLTQGGFTSPPPPVFLLNIGGTTNGSVKAYACAGVTLGNCEDVELGPFSPIAFSASGAFSLVDPGEEYMVGIKVVVTHRAGQGVISSFDAELASVPEPGTYALIGFGLAALGLLRRTRSNS